MENSYLNEKRRDILSIYLTIFCALAVRIFILELFYVPTGSMKQTILEGDYIFSTKYSYGYSNYSFPYSPNIVNDRVFASAPQRGEIVIFRPPHNMDVRYIKRLIGLPGEKIKLINDVIYINDLPITREKGEIITEEDGKQYQQYKETLPNNYSFYAYKLLNLNRSCTTEEFIIPEGHYFFLGDNRDESNDSRYELGFVPFKNFIAKARFICFSATNTLFSFKNKFYLPKVIEWVKSFRLKRVFNSL